MNTLIELEKKINSELTTKIDQSKILHNQLYIDINEDDLINISKKIVKSVEEKTGALLRS